MKGHAWGIAGIALLVACGKDEPPTVGADVPFAKLCDKANEGKRVAAVGYLRLPASFKSKELISTLRFYEGSAYDTKPIGVGVWVGSEPNRVEQPSSRSSDGSRKYSDDDLKVHLADGAIATRLTKVKVSGEMYFPLVDQKGPEGFECGLTKPLIETAR